MLTKAVFFNQKLKCKLTIHTNIVKYNYNLNWVSMYVNVLVCVSLL